MKLFITLPNGRAVGLGTYARAWRTLLAMDPSELVKGFDYFAAPAGEILAKMRSGLMDRINRNDRTYGVGRKYGEDWQREALSAARLLNTPRLVIDWLPVWLKPRFGYRLRENVV